MVTESALDTSSPGELLDGPERHATGSALTALNEVGRAITTVMDDMGYAAISGNSDLLVLATIRLDGPQRPTTLTRLTGLTSGGTTNLLDRLERAKLISRSNDGVEDGRGVLVEITRAGERAIEALGEVVATELAARPAPFQETRRRFDAIGIDLPDLPSSLTEVTAQLEDLVHLIAFARLITEAVDTALDDPTPAKSALTLWYASQPGGVRPGQLRDLTMLSSAGVSELLERLEARELIVRTAGRPPDRRVVTVETTTSGRELLAAALDALYDRSGEISDAIAGW